MVLIWAENGLGLPIYEAPRPPAGAARLQWDTATRQVIDHLDAQVFVNGDGNPLDGAGDPVAQP